MQYGYVFDHPDSRCALIFYPGAKVAGLVLCGAYLSNEYSQDDLGILSLYGSEDKVLSRDKYEKGLAYVSQRFEEYVIEGGNHAWFGNYGEQSGDGTATISHKRQWYYAGDKIARFVKNE